MTEEDSTRHSVTPRCIHKPNLGSLPQIILEICSAHDFFRIEARCQGQGRSDPKIVCGTPGPQDVSTHQRARFTKG